jgi:hypothetical protein
MYALFYRNLNLGHAGSPDRRGLEQALLDAGASAARSFQTNGTVLLTADDPQRSVMGAAHSLRAGWGYDDAAFVVPLAALQATAATGPLGGVLPDETYRETVTFCEALGADTPTFAWPYALPWTSAHGDVDLLHTGEGMALGRIRRRGTGVGNPTKEIERELGIRVTTRTFGTIQRLLKAAG